MLHIKLLGLQLRNLNSGVTNQNKYFKVNKQITWLAHEMLNFFFPKIITATRTFVLGCIPRQKSGNLHLQKDAEHAFRFLPSVLRNGSKAWKSSGTWLGLRGIQVNTAIRPTLMNTDYFSKYDGTWRGRPSLRERMQKGEVRTSWELRTTPLRDSGDTMEWEY